MSHIPDEDLERYSLGLIKNESELAPVEEHLLVCIECVVRAEESDRFVRLTKTALRLLKSSQTAV
jgi:hypothetical protein